MKDKIRNDEVDFSAPRWRNVSSKAKDLVKRLLIKSPHNRLTARGSLDHDFFASIKEKKLNSIMGEQLNENIFRQLTGYRGIS